MRRIINCDWSIVTTTMTYDYLYAIVKSILENVASNPHRFECGGTATATTGTGRYQCTQLLCAVDALYLAT